MTLTELMETIKADKTLKANFEQAMYMESLADSIDYVNKDMDSITQRDIDDHTTVNRGFCIAVENTMLTAAQYYEIKEIW